MKICIMTESVEGLGLGHVARSLNLAILFLDMGYEVDFFVRGDADFSHFLAQQNIAQYKHFYPLKIEWNQLKNKNLLESDICILDTYEITDFSLFLQYAKILVLFDDDGRHVELLHTTLQKDATNSFDLYKECEENNMLAKLFLLNPNGFYKTLLLEATYDNGELMRQRIFSGLEYVLLNSCFKKSCFLNINEKKYDFFVCLGGEDLQDKSYEVFAQLSNFSKNLAVIIGANYKGKLLDFCHDRSLLLQHFANGENYDIFHNISQEQVANLIANSKACIVSGGGIVFEALALCPRVFTLNLASNQNEQIEVLKNQGFLHEVTLPLNEREFKSKENKNNHELFNLIGSSLGDFASGLIFDCINQAIIHNKYKKPRNFTVYTLEAIDFCNISENEARSILAYRNHPSVRENMYGNTLIDEKTHFNFIRSLQGNNNSRYFLVKDGNTHIGVINLSKINFKHRHAYLGIYKNPFLSTKSFSISNVIDTAEREVDALQKQKKSCGSLLMDVIKHIAFKHYHLHMLYLEVIESNKHAIAFYEREGFLLFGKLKNGFRVGKNHNEQFCDICIYGLENTLEKI